MLSFPIRFKVVGLMKTLLLLTLLTVGAASPPPDVKQWQLSNGLHVIFLTDHKAPVVTVQLFYHAGGKDEPAEKRGIAHMFEHMMFKGSKHVAPEQHARFIDSVGGTENAFTDDDATGYHDTVPPYALEFTLQLEAERMRNLALVQKTIDSEREVVKEELRMRLENSPVRQAIEKLLQLAFVTHPYRLSPIGEKAMLDTVTISDCQRFYDTFYRPNNATLIVVGDVDEARVRTLVERHFGPLERGPERPVLGAKEAPQTEPRNASLTMPVRLPVLVGAYHIPEAASDDLYALDVLQRVLSGGESSRLHQRLVRHDRSAIAAGGFVFAHEDPGLFVTYAAYLPTGDSSQIQRSLDEEIARLVQQPIEPRELTKAKNQLAAQSVYHRERVTELATEMGMDGIVVHDPLRGFHAADRYETVTAHDVMRVAGRYLAPHLRSLVVLVPAKEGRP